MFENVKIYKKRPKASDTPKTYEFCSTGGSADPSRPDEFGTGLRRVRDGFETRLRRVRDAQIWNRRRQV